MTTTPYSLAVANAPLPFALKPLQEAIVNTRAPCARTGIYAQVGTGKTAMSTSISVYQIVSGMSDCYVVTCPPILIPQWSRWLQKIPNVDVLAYRGTPKQRAALKLTARDSESGAMVPAYDFIVMSLDIFKRDYERIVNEFKDVTVGLTVDEATAVKNVESDNFKYVRDFSAGRPLQLLTGRPLATPNDAYAYIKLLAPDVYRSKRVFDSVHVADRDLWGNVKQWQNLDLMHTNMKVNSVQLMKKDVWPDLADPIYDKLEYELHPEHMALYVRLAEEQILELESGGKIDATAVATLYTRLQQIILNWDYFSERPDNIAAGFDLCDEVMEELGVGEPGGAKLIIYANYRMTMGALYRRYQKIGIEVINGETPAGSRDRLVQEFISNPRKCAVAIQPKSGGFGLDGLQTVCSDVLILEEPISPIEFVQSVGRVDRPGQESTPHIRIAVALKTIQERLHRLLLVKDEQTARIEGGWQFLREAIRGG